MSTRRAGSPLRLRARLAVLMLAVVTVFVIAGIALNSWFARSSLLAAVDEQLDDRAELARTITAASGVPPVGVELDAPPTAPVALPQLSESAVRFQFLDRDGDVLFGDRSLPVDPTVLASAGDGQAHYRSIEQEGRDFRVRTEMLAGGFALQVATSIDSINDGLSSLQATVWLAGLASVFMAGLLGWWLAGRFVRPIVDVTVATSRLASADALPEPIDARGRSDEIGELVTSFNTLTEALRRSASDQERLVADASHELRTPLTSLRMKIDFLDAEPDLAPERRKEVVRGAAVELESLSDLVSELVTLARREPTIEPLERIALGDLVAEVVDRMASSTGRRIEFDRDDTMAHVRPGAIRRAVSNLIDNAHKYSPTDRPIAVRQAGRSIEVTDDGPGITDTDRDHAFDRFYRSPSAQVLPGSGIGLAIVRQVARDHGGDASIDNAPDGGVVARFTLGDADGAVPERGSG